MSTDHFRGDHRRNAAAAMGTTAAKPRTTARSAPLVLPLTLEVAVEDEPALAPVRVAERLDEVDVAVPFRRIAFLYEYY